MQPTVVIIQNRLPRYRVSLFEQLKENLGQRGVHLRLLHGMSSTAERTRQDEGTLDWSELVRNRYLPGPCKQLVWQQLPRDVRQADLTIITQESGILSNYPLLLGRHLGGPAVAYWGHGRNFQSISPAGLREKWKRFVLPRVDWWFAYTSVTVDHLVECGFPKSRITNLQNSTDVAAFRAELGSVTDAELALLRRELGLANSSRVGLFCGSIYPEKRIGQLLESARLIRSAIPDFHFIVVGEGPSAGEVSKVAESAPWLHYVGSAYDRRKAAYYRLADVQLNPRLLGLNILDALAAGVPPVVARNCIHSPEIAYLRAGVNGLVTDSEEPAQFAAAVVALLNDAQTLASLRHNCLMDARKYGVDKMASNFCAGILQCLAATAKSDAWRDGLA